MHISGTTVKTTEKPSLLSKIGKGLVSFGTGIPQIELDRRATQNELNDTEIRRLEQEIEANEAAAIKQQHDQVLAKTAFGNGPDAFKAKAQLAINNPEAFNDIATNMGLIDDGKKLEAANFALELQKTPFDERQTKIDKRITDLVSQGRDPQHTASLTGLSEEDQNTSLEVTQLLPLTPAQRQNIAKGVTEPFELRTFRAQTEEMNRLTEIPEGERTQSEKDTLRAIRVDLGVDPRAVGSG